MNGTDITNATGKTRQRIRLGDLLVEQKVISENQLQQALREQKTSGHKLGRVLVQLGFISDGELMEFLSRQLNIPIVDLKHYKFRPQTVRLLPEQHARRYRAIVLAEKKNDLTVGMADPTDLFAFDELRRLLKKPLSIALVREDDLLRAIDTVYRRTEEISTLAEELGEELSDSDYDLAELDSESEEDDAPVIKLLRSMFEDAVQIGASDIHIEPDESVVRIRQRVDGELQEQIIEGRRIASALVTRLKLMAALNISEKRLPQDGRFSIRVKKRRIDVRLSTMPIQYGESMVMRLLDQTDGLLQLDTLGMPERMLPRIRRTIERQSGMMLVTGPTGSGKTTTLYAALNHINTPDSKIITVEDPVEYRLPRINQVQVHSKIGLDFARVLRTALRQDPDIIMVGEMRDRETVEIGLRAAMTGHLVLSTLHTNNAIDTVIRLLDMGAEGFMVAASLNAVIAQRLVRRVCDSCGEPTEPDAHQRAWLAKQLSEEQLARAEFKHGPGCAYCSNTGYRGRIGVYEMLEIDEPLADALRQADTGAFTRAARNQRGFRPLVTNALDYAMQGISSVEDVIRLAGGVDAYTEELSLEASTSSAPLPDNNAGGGLA